MIRAVKYRTLTMSPATDGAAPVVVRCPRASVRTLRVATISLARLRHAAAALVLAGMAAGPAMADAPPLRVWVAGSLAAVMPALIKGAGLDPGTVAPPVFGPAGGLAARLVAGATLPGGAHADLFASADQAQAQAVARATGALVFPFARNRMCLLAPAALGITPANMLDRVLVPGFRLATSTPGNDPSGDYALAAFARADAVRPGAGATLRAKAVHLRGGPKRDPVAAIFAAGSADGVLSYCSRVPTAGLAATPLPSALEPGPVYAMAVDPQAAAAERLAVFIVSAGGQAILRAGGLLPLVPDTTSH